MQKVACCEKVCLHIEKLVVFVHESQGSIDFHANDLIAKFISGLNISMNTCFENIYPSKRIIACNFAFI